MMKYLKKYWFVLVLFIFLFIPSKADAASVSVSLSCPTSANASSTISCKVNVTSSVKVTGLSLNYSFSTSNFTYVSFTASSGFSSYNDTSSGFLVGNTSGKSGTFTIGTIKLKLISKGTFKIKNITASDYNDNAYSLSSKSATIRTNSTNNSLASLSLSSGTLSPSFSASTTSYTATVDASSVTISATKGESNQTISGTGKKTLSYGTNTFSIKVTSESGSTKTYKIVITRPDNRNSDNYLKSLTLSSGSLSFNKTTTEYDVTVDSDVSSLKITATLNDSSASFVSGYGSRTVDLDYGKNTILVKVKAENTSVRTYTLNVTRTDDRSSNNYLKSLTLSSGNINFDKDKSEYTFSVMYDVTSLEIETLLEDESASVKVNNTDLVVGENVITIVVTAENGDTRTYTLNVNRLTEEETLAINPDAKNIEILGYEFDFETDTLEYNITINGEYALVFVVTLDDEDSTYVINGNEDLVDGSKIEIVITSVAGEEKTYTFNITKKTKISGIIYLILGILIGMVVMCIAYIIITKTNLLKKKESKEGMTK